MTDTFGLKVIGFERGSKETDGDCFVSYSLEGLIILNASNIIKDMCELSKSS